jgi:large subunit ribosomal protein L2
MGFRKMKPVTPGTRFAEVLDFSDLAKKRPEKSLTCFLPKSGGRNNLGRVTIAARGGGHKRLYRIVDFRYSKKGLSGVVESIEYDPNRSARIALTLWEDGIKTYVVAPAGLAAGANLQSGPHAKIELGNSMPLKNVPLGAEVFCVEMDPGRGAKIARSAGNNATVEAKDMGNVHLRMPSGEVRLVSENCYATMGKVGNSDHGNISLGKAGRMIHLGKRPKSRAVVKNPIDHPMGGGEGKSSGGRHPCSPWGQIAKGLKTRKKKKPSSAKIIKRRK